MYIYYALAATIIVSLVSLIGVITISLSSSTIKSLSFLLVSLAAGTLIGDVFIHLLPEVANANNQGLWLWIVFGIGLFFILEKIIHWRHCHVQTSKDHPHPVGTMNLIGDGFHNFLDGILITGSFMVNVELGIATTLAVIFHEIPQEIGDFGVLIHAGYSKLKAIGWNFVSALFAIVGALITWIIGSKIESLNEIFIPITAGGFIYIAISDLLPEMRKETAWKKSLGQLIIMSFGIFIMYWLKIILE